MQRITKGAFQLRWGLLCLHEARSLWKLSDPFSFGVELNHVEIQDPGRPNGSSLDLHYTYTKSSLM